MTEAEALAAIARYESLTVGFGGPNAQALQEVKEIARSLEYGPIETGDFKVKLTELVEWATIGFSIRKFQKYARGAEGIRHLALTSAASLRRIIYRDWQDDSNG